MSPHVRLRHLPGRLTTGVFIVNSGLSERHADDDTVAALHGMAAVAYPFLHFDSRGDSSAWSAPENWRWGPRCSFLSYPP
jgi:hypothetical protein